jgi:phage shock protein C
MVCEACSQQMNTGVRFCSGCGRPLAAEGYVPAYGRLVRPRHGRVLAGVCAGFAQQYGWDPILLRLIVCAVVLFGCGSPILLYLIAWMVMPNGPYFSPTQGYPTQPNAPADGQAAA